MAQVFLHAASRPDWLACWLVGWLAGWADWLAGWSVGWVGCLVGWSVEVGLLVEGVVSWLVDCDWAGVS